MRTEYYKEWREKNKERINELGRIRYWKTPEKFKKQSIKWRKKNKSKYLKKQKKDRKYLKNNGLCINCGKPRENSPSTIHCNPCYYHFRKTSKISRKNRQAKYKKLGLCSKCGKSLRGSRSKYLCKRCYQVFLTCSKRRFKKKHDEITEQRRILGHIYKFRALQIISGERIPRCIKCGEKDIRILTINHKNGRESERKLHNVTKKRYLHGIYQKIVYGKYKANLKELDVRCYNCNILYEYENQRRLEYPRKQVIKYLKNKGFL